MFERFLLIGHTPVYWPLIALFALTTSGRRYRTAAVVLGVLLGARSPMIALVPTYFILLWRNDRRAIAPAAVLLVLTVAVTFGPFLLWDWRTLMYGMYGNYVRVIHDFVWTQTNWMSSTLGIDAPAGRVRMVPGRRPRAGSGVGADLWADVVAATARRVGSALVVPRAHRPSVMTTLWPVWYVFLDVFVLGLSFFVAEHVRELRSAPWKSMAGTTALAASAIFITLLINPGVYYTIEAGRRAQVASQKRVRRRSSKRARDASRGRRASAVHLRLPRGLRTNASIQIECDPFTVQGAPAQTMGASLNGSPIGQVTLSPGWQTVTFPTRARAWRIGHNDVTLFFRYALPSESGEVRAARIGHISIVR